MPGDVASFVPSYEHDFYPGQTFPIFGPTAADVIRGIERLVDVGVGHFQASFDDMGTLRRFIHEVVPTVRLEPQPT